MWSNSKIICKGITMKKEKGKKSKASKLADKAAKKAKKKEKKKKSIDEKAGSTIEPGYYQFKNTVALVKKTGKKKETCSKCIHYYKGRFCRREGPSIHLAVVNRLLNCGMTAKEASDRSYYLPEVPASWHCKNWREEQ